MNLSPQFCIVQDIANGVKSHTDRHCSFPDIKVTFHGIKSLRGDFPLP